MSPARRLILLVLAIAALAVTAAWTPLGEVPAAVGRLGVFGPVAGVLVGAALLAALVPRTPISLACGVIFGATTGAACALAVAFAGAAVTFAAGRVLGRDFAARRGGRWWPRIDAWVGREGALAVAALRSLPIGPFGLAGYAYGASAIRVRDYALGTLVAAPPSAVAYAVIGAAVVAPGTANPLTVLPLVAGALLATALVVRARARARRTTDAAPAEPTPDEAAPSSDR
jgi:uncharacterized membrane protein YdjX (TVP38/TMEM64 family)